jgi:NAD(P)-dependent dehydrogenase (short-subunit alcohol dehydrogenase family)
MKLRNQVIVVTGGANGIGRALARRFAHEGAHGVVIGDLDEAGAQRVAAEIGGRALGVDVSREADLRRLIELAESAYGPVDLFCSNAGIGGPAGGPEIPDEEWQRIWEINVLAHIYAARAVLPSMLARGKGYLLNTVSAAGLLSQVGSAPYSVTKHAALAFAEWLSITHGAAGIRVSVLCPQGVRTNMLGASGHRAAEFLRATALDPEEVAEATVAGIEAERFLILPHPEVAEFFRRKGDDYERWLRGMRRLQAKLSDPSTERTNSRGDEA